MPRWPARRWRFPRTWSGSRSASRRSTTSSRTSPARSPEVAASRHLVVCVDVGSTFTKGAPVDLGAGVLLGTASHPTTLSTDVMDGVDAVRSSLDAGAVETLACSSAGGGLRLAVVGYERLVTAEAAFRVGLSAGARVEHVAAGPMS